MGDMADWQKDQMHGEDDINLRPEQKAKQTDLEKLQDENWPSIGYDIQGRMFQGVHGLWFWKVTVHFLGPDDVIEHGSQGFDGKGQCVDDMIKNFGNTVIKILAEF